jgi:hypothetical protein
MIPTRRDIMDLSNTETVITRGKDAGGDAFAITADAEWIFLHVSDHRFTGQEDVQAALTRRQARCLRDDLNRFLGE